MKLAANKGTPRALLGGPRARGQSPSSDRYSFAPDSTKSAMR